MDRGRLVISLVASPAVTGKRYSVSLVFLKIEIVLCIWDKVMLCKSSGEYYKTLNNREFLIFVDSAVYFLVKCQHFFCTWPYIH